MDKVITVLDYAKREGAATVRDRIKKICEKKISRGIMDTKFDTSKTTGKKVLAELNYGQWIGRCECGGAEAVCPSDPVFFCFSCGNFANKGRLRPVVFPGNREQIEKAVMKRPVKIGVGTHEIERLTLAKPTVIVPGGILSRSWTPDESLKDIEEQNKLGDIR